ncbi:protein MODIFIER OF SNC1 1-like isoform X1 [Populus nigra]|uniref:protein MODIFIER OF SNC1 1-like isoform X1 n=2 Tax=Populus nigra TaxID=3691 RepID=UPI002B26C67E|nr:protein MODIFIER OF SNC1 1-like isoform X1 [Populus nigra]XP_061952725.1 protein MODIFIER OF SNC1 1-like isoform X1 [Populus nigra]
MTSSMLTGDRRYAPARRGGGMTSLGKIVVPKPINLPSQRLENHGLDPNVEIVPKGTHSWGTRSSSSTPNAWGSSTLSPNTDGGSGSPSHLSGRPSSGGSGTRPSTAGSDRTHDPIASAWGTNSRPSSASGALTSNQTSFTSLRPCSAETRPGSSQLSRFAEPLSDNSVAWVATGTAEKLGGTSSKNEGFSLTSGDFPTLGSEKENSGKNTESQDHDSCSRPGSSSGGVAPGKESAENSAGDASINTNAKMEPANSWRRENPMCGEDGLRPSMEKWHPDHQLCPNSNIRPQNYDSWHGPPVNNPPGGVWYRGPPGGPPFAPPIAPGGFPMEPFPYYCPQIPPTALANPQQGPPPGPGPRGPHPTNGDMYRPHMHDAFMRPGMPFRPGFYPGPVPYEGYYASHMGYCNSNDRDIQFMGMAVGPAPYNRFSGQNAPDPGNSHGRPGGYGPPSGHTMVPEQLESGHPQDIRGPFKVLLKQHDGLEGKDKEQKWDDMMATNASYPGKAGHQRKSSWENGWSADEKNNKERNTRRIGEEFSSEANGNQGGVKVKPLEHVGNWKAADDSSVKKLEHAASGFPEVSTAPKDPSLIRKIEGLNAKARASDGRQEVKFSSSREEHKNRLQGGNARSNHSANEAGNSYASLERTHVCGISDTASHEDRISAADKSHEVTDAIGTASSRRSTHGMHGRLDHHGKGRFSTQEAEGWRRRSHVADLPSVLPSSHFESSNVHRQDHSPAEATEKSGSYHQGKDDGESVLPHPDPSDSQVQRAKMKELACQRVKQREKEEEERARDQKAKALAKLAELNKRTKAAKSLSEVLPGMPKATHKESVVIHDELEPLQQDVSRADGDHPDNAPQTYDNRASKQKRVSYRQKQNGPLEKTCNDKLMTSIIEAPKNVTDVAANAPVSIEGATEMTTSPESTLPINPTATTESSVHHGRRKNRNGKNKYKVEEASSMAVVVTPTLSKEITALDISVESSKSKASESVSDPSSQTDSRDGNQSLDHRTSSPNEEVQGRVNNQWKSQYSRRMPRNPQANKSTEKFQSGDAVIWAPVRSHNKIEATDEASQKTLVDAISEPMKSDQQVQNNTRNKRAEMERYIPKSVAKEMAQQGSIPHSAAPLINQITPDETAGRPESRSLGNESSQSPATGMGKVVSILESKNGDGRQNKSGKRNGSWRQRGSSESTMFFTSKNVQKSIEHQVQKPDVSSVKEQLGHYDEWSDSDGWNIPEKSEVPITVPAIKDHGATARARRQSYRGHKSSHDPDEKRINTGDAEKVHVQTLGSEMHQADSAATSKENRAVGERPASHWQPKSQPISVTTNPGSRASGGQNTGSEVGRGNKKDSTSQNGMPVLPQPDKDIAAEAQSHPDGSLSARSNLEEDPSTGHQEGKKERKIASHKGHPAEPSPLNMDFQQRVSSGFRKNGNQNSRFGREHDSRGGEWSGPGKDNEHHNRERQRQNSHYEYQPVGPQYNNKANNYESSKDGSHNSVARSRERGQSHSRRGGGNSHGQQPGGARVDANYD